MNLQRNSAAGHAGRCAAIFSRSFRELQFTDIPRYCRLCHMISGLFQILRKLLLRLDLIFSDQLHDLTVDVGH